MSPVGWIGMSQDSIMLPGMTYNLKCINFFTPTFYLIFLDHGLLQVTEIIESETPDKG